MKKVTRENQQVTPMIGDIWRRRNAKRKIVALYSDIPGGVILDRPIEGFRSWNVEELKFVERGSEVAQEQKER